MNTSIDTLLEEIIAREGSKDTNDPNDSGGRTKFGISQRWHPEIWENGPPTKEIAKEVYLRDYVVRPNIHQITPDFLMGQLVDYAVLSGPHRAIVAVQHVIHAPEDGVIGPVTLELLSKRNPIEVNNNIVDRRVLLMTRLVQQRPKDLVWLFGWVSRALKFRV